MRIVFLVSSHSNNKKQLLLDACMHARITAPSALGRGCKSDCIYYTLQLVGDNYRGNSIMHLRQLREAATHFKPAKKKK